MTVHQAAYIEAKEKEIETLREEVDLYYKRLLECGAAFNELQNEKDEWKRRADDRQATIDALMFEHCPDEMTPEQIAEYEKNMFEEKDDA